MVFLWRAGFLMIEFPWGWGGEGFLEGENHTQIKTNYPPRILQLLWSGLYKNTC